MNAALIRTIAWLLVAPVTNPITVIGQTVAAGANDAQPDGPQRAAAPVFSREEIDQMTAPIALYPDQLLAQVLVAATYPLEIVLADRWASDPANAQLKGDRLAAALEPQTWDPSVKSLTPFPQVLKMMSEKLDWTQRLGDAFLAQQADVMDSVQRLRRQAQDSGNLKSSEQQAVETKRETVVVRNVVTERETIVIQPAKPEVIYVPAYNPTAVYGTWPYPAYPPIYYPPPPAYYPGAAYASGIAFGLGVATVGALWGWGNCNWGSNNINISASRYNNINATNIQVGRATQLPANTGTWAHNPSHRGGVAYRDPATRQAYQGQGTMSGATSRDFRGYGDRVGQSTNRGVEQAKRGTDRAANRGAGWAANRGADRTADRGVGQIANRGADRAANRGAAQTAGRSARQGIGQGTSRPPAATSSIGQRQPGVGGAGRVREQPAAFQSVGNGSQVRAQSDRGRASLQSVGANVGPAGRTAPARGGMRAGGGAGIGARR